MTAASYLAFVSIALIVIVSPGADFAVVLRNTLAGGRARGHATSAGVTVSNVVQGAAAVGGLGAAIAASETVFLSIKYAGAAYLAWLAICALRSAARGDYTPSETSPGKGFRQGVLTNITNPKVLVFYLAVLPQFSTADTSHLALIALAMTHALISWAYLSGLVTVFHWAQRWLTRRPVRRALDGLTATAMAGLAARIALE